MHRRAVDQIGSAITMTAELASKQGFRFVAVFHPTLGECGSETYEFGLHSLISKLRQPKINFGVFDLLARWQSDERITGQMMNKYYWPTDGHHNSAGYEKMGRTFRRSY